jgi:hypothetical protein
LPRTDIDERADDVADHVLKERIGAEVEAQLVAS